MKAKAFLQQLKKIDALIKNKRIERDMLWDVATNTVATMHGERVKSSGNPQRMASASDARIDLEREIDECIARLTATRRDVIEVIEQLNATEYDLLHKIYVQHILMCDVAQIIDKSYSWVTTVHGRALKHVQNILDARENNQ